MQIIRKIPTSLLFFFTVFSFFYLAQIEASVKVVPLLDLRLGGGNSYFEGKSSSFGGNFNLDFVPALKFGNKLSLLPRYSANYSGYRLAVELEDEESLYQETFDNLLAFKLIYKILPDLKLRTEYGYNKELLKETKDESWGKGLYDYNNPYTNIELENKFNVGDYFSFILGGGARIYDIIYPNYTSLATQINKEFMGEDVLDNENKDVFINGEIFINPNCFVKWGFTNTQSDYNDQKIIDKNGDYLEEKRNDKINNFNIGVRFNPDKEFYMDISGENVYTMYFGTDLSFKKKVSNQNHFDTDLLVYIPHYYSYNQFKLNPFINFKFMPGNTNVFLSYEFSYKKYPDRLAQNSLGEHTNEQFYSRANALSLKISAPVRGENLWAEIGASYRKVSSNMEYEKFYSYNYGSADYFLGIRYEY